MASHSPVPAVVTALNLNGLGVARALGRHGVPVFGVHASPDGPELRSRYVREIWRPEPGMGLAELLIARQKTLGGVRPVLFPITDESVEAVARALDRLTPCYRVPMGDPATVLLQLSKEGVDAAARAHGMPVPPTRTCSSLAELEAATLALRPPYILKPRDKSEAYAKSGAKKAFRLETSAEVLATYGSFCELHPRVVLQEFIPGSDADVFFCLLAMGQDGQPLATFVGHKLRQWPPHCGGTAACEPAEAPELVALSLAYFRSVGLTGLGSIEFKRDPRDGRVFMIEPTVCRTDWQSALAAAPGASTQAPAAGRSAPRAKATTTRWPRASTGSTSGSSSTPTAPGPASKTSSSPPSNTSTGSTIDAATARSSTVAAASPPQQPTKPSSTVRQPPPPRRRPNSQSLYETRGASSAPLSVVLGFESECSVDEDPIDCRGLGARRPAWNRTVGPSHA